MSETEAVIAEIERLLTGFKEVEEKVRHVRDAAFWGAPVGTPLPLAKPSVRVPDAKPVGIPEGDPPDTQPVLDPVPPFPDNPLSAREYYDRLDTQYHNAIGAEPLRGQPLLSNAVADRMKRIRHARANWSISADKDRADAIEQVKIAREGRVCLAEDPKAAAQIMFDGVVKTQFLTGTSNGTNWPSMRAEAETGMFDVPVDLPPEDRPVYGFVATGYSAQRSPLQERVSQYGAVRFVLKPEVAERTTCCLDDSLSAENGIPVPMTGEVSDEQLFAANPNWQHTEDTRYIEAEIHGRVTTADIAEVWLPDDMFMSDPDFVKVIDYADSLGIPVHWYHMGQEVDRPSRFPDSKGLRHVRDEAYWGAPAGTPLPLKPGEGFIDRQPVRPDHRYFLEDYGADLNAAVEHGALPEMPPVATPGSSRHNMDVLPPTSLPMDMRCLNDGGGPGTCLREKGHEGLCVDANGYGFEGHKLTSLRDHNPLMQAEVVAQDPDWYVDFDSCQEIRMAAYELCSEDPEHPPVVDARMRVPEGESPLSSEVSEMLGVPHQPDLDQEHRREQARDLLRGIEAAPEYDGDLYRSIWVPKGRMDGVKVGQEIDVPLVSTGDEWEQVEGFFGNRDILPSPDSVETVTFVFQHPKAVPGMPYNPAYVLSPTRMHELWADGSPYVTLREDNGNIAVNWGEMALRGADPKSLGIEEELRFREYVVGGKFTVTGVKRSKGKTIVTVSQDDVFHIKGLAISEYDDLFSFPLNPTGELFTAGYPKRYGPEPETKVRHVRDAAFWGVPVGTPLPLAKPVTPDAKPLGQSESPQIRRAMRGEEIVEVYHGTTTERAESIRKTGLRRPSGVGPGWLMVTSSREDAERYATGYRGTPTVITLRVPRKLLSNTQRHLGGEAWGILQDVIPPEYIVDDEKPSPSLDVSEADSLVYGTKVLVAKLNSLLAGFQAVEQKIRHVQDAAYWGAPVGTPLPLPEGFRRRPRVRRRVPDAYTLPPSLHQVAPVKTSLSDFEGGDADYINNAGDDANPAHVMTRYARDPDRRHDVKVSVNEVADHVVEYVSAANDDDIADGEQWYYDVRSLAEDWSKKYGTDERPLTPEVAAAAISALSPHNLWPSNKLLAERMIALWAKDDFEGKPTRVAAETSKCGLYDCVEEGIKVLRSGDPSLLTGAKRKSFANCMADPDDGYDVTVDGWIAGLLDRIGKGYTEDDAVAWLTQSRTRNKVVVVQGAGYVIIADAFRQATERLNVERRKRGLREWTPQQLQAIYWVKAKREADEAEGQATMWPSSKGLLGKNSDWPYIDPHLDPDGGMATDPDYFDAYTIIEASDTGIKMPSAWQTYLRADKPRYAVDNPAAQALVPVILAGQIKVLLDGFKAVEEKRAGGHGHVRDAAFWGAPVGTPLPLPKHSDPTDFSPGDVVGTIDLTPPMAYDPATLTAANLDPNVETVKWDRDGTEYQDWGDLVVGRRPDDSRLEMAASMAFQRVENQGRVFKTSAEVDGFVTEVLERAGYHNRIVSINVNKGLLGKNVEAGVSRGMTEQLPKDHPLHNAVIPCLVYRQRGVSEFVLLHEIAHIIEGSWKSSDGGGHNEKWWDTFGALLAQHGNMDGARNMLQFFGFSFEGAGALK